MSDQPPDDGYPGMTPPGATDITVSMSDIDRIINAVHLYDQLRTEGEAVTVNDYDLETDTVDEAITLHRTATRLRKALQEIEKALAVQLAETLGEGGAVRYGDTFYRYHRGLKESVVNVEAFWSMVQTFDLRIEDLFNPNDVRKGPLPAAIRDTAFAKVRDKDPSLSVVPADKAPRFLQDLGDGDYVLGRRI
jgi:hypothetical protein